MKNLKIEIPTLQIESVTMLGGILYLKTSKMRFFDLAKNFNVNFDAENYVSGYFRYEIQMQHKILD